jgi:hypothetical protein
MTRLKGGVGVGDLDAITNQVVTMLEDLGLFFPRAVEAEEMPFPSDITSVSLLELGEMHSYYTAQFARTTSLHGIVVAQKRSLKFELGRLRSIGDQLGGDRVNDRRLQIEAEFARVDAADAMVSGLVEAHKRYAEACSRELTRRQVEANLAR